LHAAGIQARLHPVAGEEKVLVAGLVRAQPVLDAARRGEHVALGGLEVREPVLRVEPRRAPAAPPGEQAPVEATAPTVDALRPDAGRVAAEVVHRAGPGP